MKLAVIPSQIVSSGNLGEQAAFKITASAQAFKILSSSLYSDKVGAVLREIGCNAYDAHVAAGKEKIPFIVKLPNALDNEFYIRDFGPGLSRDEVMNLYTTYFASTKGDSNDFTGAFGLGSKSPFSYTDSFTITSWHAALKTVYSAHIGANGAPMVAVLGTEMCDPSETGISIGFPVRPDDYFEFRNKATQIYKYFATIPEVHGSEPIVAPKYQDCGDFWYIEPESYNSYPPAILMGNVYYPLDVNQLKDSHITDDIQNIILRVPIGTVQVTASREHIEYTEEVQKYLRQRLKDVVRYMCLNLVSLYKDVIKTDTWAARCAFIKTKRQRIGISYASEEVLIAAGIAPDLAKQIGSHGSDYLTWPQVLTAVGAILYRVSASGRRTSKGDIVLNQQTAGSHYFHVIDDLTIVWNDGASNAVGRLRKALTEGTLTGRIVYCPDRAAADKIEIELLKGVQMWPLSKFEAPPVAVRASQRRKKGAKASIPKELLESSKKYVLTRSKSSWGNVRHFRYLGLREWEEGTWDSYVNRFMSLKKVLPDLLEPIEIKHADLVRYKLDKDPEWQPYTEYVKDVLESKNTKDLVQKMHDAVYDRLDVDSEGLFANLCLLEWKGKLTQMDKDVLAKYDILDPVVETVRTEKALPERANEISALFTLRETLRCSCDWVSAEKTNYRTDRTTVAPMNTKFAKASSISFSTLHDLVGHEVFPEFLDLILSKGA